MEERKTLPGLAILGILAAVILIAAFAAFSIYDTPQKKPTTDSNNIPAPTRVQVTKTQLANPASVNCENLGGKTVIQTRGDGGKYGICVFDNNYMCEEWALLRNSCPVGGVRITGYDHPSQIYCAISGGKTTATESATCTFNDGSVCTDIDFYNGKCQKGQNP